MNRVIVVRHGRTSWNAEGRVQGISDIDLSDAGRSHAQASAAALLNYSPTQIYSSDLRRSIETARPIADATGIAIEVDKRLRERCFGSWEGLTHNEIAARFPHDHKRWRSRLPLEDPSIESWESVRMRVDDFANDLINKLSDDSALVVCHSASARHLIASILGWNQNVVATLGGLGNVNWAVLCQAEIGGWRLHGYNLGIDADLIVRHLELASWDPDPSQHRCAVPLRRSWSAVR